MESVSNHSDLLFEPQQIQQVRLIFMFVLTSLISDGTERVSVHVQAEVKFTRIFRSLSEQV